MVTPFGRKLDAQGAPDPQYLTAAKEQVVSLLRTARQGIKDSPIYQRLDDFPSSVLDHEKTDIFREQVQYSRTIKHRLLAARQ